MTKSVQIPSSGHNLLPPPLFEVADPAIMRSDLYLHKNKIKYMEGKNEDTCTCSYEFSYLAGARRILLGLRLRGLRPFPAS